MVKKRKAGEGAAAPSPEESLKTFKESASVIFGTAEGDGEIKNAHLSVRRIGGGFSANTPMSGSATSLRAAIVVTEPGTYRVSVDVTAADGTMWKAGAGPKAVKSSSGSRTIVGATDSWSTSVTVP